MGELDAESLEIGLLKGRVLALEADVSDMRDQLRAANDKLDRLLAAAAMGKGAWWAALKIGGFAITVGGLAIAAWRAVKG